MTRGKPAIAILTTALFALGSTGCKVFVPETAFTNGGKPVENPIVVEKAVPTIPLRPTETTLYWAINGGDQLDRQAGSNKAVVYYGHKEKPEKAEEPPEAPFLVLAKSVKDGKRERAVITFDKPPPETLIYRLKIMNIGSAAYRGTLKLVDQLPEEVRYLGVKGVHKRHMVWLPYIGNVETKSKLEGWQVDPPTGGMGTRVQWRIGEVEIKERHWITVDIEFEPPPFDISKG